MSDPNAPRDALHWLEQELLEVEWLGRAVEDPLEQELLQAEWIGSAPLRD